jgi:TolB protein
MRGARQDVTMTGDSGKGAEIRAVTVLTVVTAVAALAAVTTSASSGASRAAPEAIVYGGRVLCPYVRYPERCEGPGYNGAIFVIARPGAPSRRITDRRFDDAGPAWSPDRRRIAFARSVAPGAGSQIWVMNADGTGASQVTRGRDGGPAWSPDGRWIAFTRNTARADLFVVRPDGTGLRNVTRNPAGADAFGSTWSRDGSRIAFRRMAAPAGTGIYSIGVDGRSLRRLAREAHEPEWSPSGHRIAYLSQDRAVGPGWQVYVMGPNGGGKRRVSRAGTWAFPTWSPDSRRLVVAHDERRLAVMRLDGTIARWLTQRRPGFAIGGVDW